LPYKIYQVYFFRSHCTNFNDENYAESILNGVSRLRGILKKESASLGMKSHWTLDGIGALLGTNLGESYGTNKEAITELRPVESLGNRNLSKAIMGAIEKLGTSFGQTDLDLGQESSTGFSGTQSRKERSFFWRGFSSPVGDAVGRVRLSGDSLNNGGRSQRGQRAYHPYRRK
jgi:hypothetical protein